MSDNNAFASVWKAQPSAEAGEIFHTGGDDLDLSSTSMNISENDVPVKFCIDLFRCQTKIGSYRSALAIRASC